MEQILVNRQMFEHIHIFNITRDEGAYRPHFFKMLRVSADKKYLISGGKNVCEMESSTRHFRHYHCRYFADLLRCRGD